MNTQYRSLADMVFYRTIVENNLRISVQPELVTSIFSVTGNNLAWSDLSHEEWEQEMASLPWYVTRRHALAYRYTNLLRRVIDWFCRAPKTFAVYVGKQTVREELIIESPSARWGRTF